MGAISYDKLFSRAAVTMQESAIRKMGALGLRIPDLISFAAEFPAPDIFAWAVYRGIVVVAVGGPNVTRLGSGATGPRVGSKLRVTSVAEAPVAMSRVR